MAKTRLNEITTESINIRIRIIKFNEKVQIQLTWVEANSIFPEHLLQKIIEGIRIEMALLKFCRKGLCKIEK